MTNELKPCPFCGMTAPEISSCDPETGDFRKGVYCPNCGGGIYPYKRSKEEAISLWNTRYERTCKPVEKHNMYECSECGGLLQNVDPVYPLPNYCGNCGAKVVTDGK